MSRPQCPHRPGAVGRDRLRDRWGRFPVKRTAREVDTGSWDRDRERFDAGTVGAAGASVRRDDGRALVVRREGETGWSEPGGEQEPGEPPTRTAVRETREAPRRTPVRPSVPGAKRIRYTRRGRRSDRLTVSDQTDTGAAADAGDDEPEWSLIGPGLLVAATGVGAGDLVAALVAGSRYGLNFVWAIVLGVAVKFALNEGVGRYHLVTGETILDGIDSLGRWATGFFGGYTLIWGFVYGAAVAASCSLAATALFPGIPFWVYVVAHPIAGCILVLANRYETFESIITVFVSLMFVSVIGSALLVLPQVDDILATGIPALPEGSVVYALGLVGGAGGTITMASYGYWLAEKDWDSPRHVRTMRLDASSAYVITGIFSVALIVMSAALLYGTGASVSGEEGLVVLANNLGDQLHPLLRSAFLVGFWAASFTSLLGVWHGVSYLFADFVETATTETDAATGRDEEWLRGTKWYTFYVLWLTFPPMLLYFVGRPVFLIVLYGALGAVFMPFLAGVLLVLLNSDRVSPDGRNHWLSNGMLVVSALLFIALMVVQFLELLP